MKNSIINKIARKWTVRITFYRLANFRIALVFLLCIITLTNCKKFIEIPPPNTQLVSTSVFNNNGTATSAQLSIYSLMWNNAESFNMAQNMGLYADELQNYSTQSTQIQFYTNALQASMNPGPWISYYQYIFFANSVITGLQTTAGCSKAVINQLTGEAMFTRAFCLFYLTNIYGDVPIVLTTDVNINGKISRSSRLRVLQQVVTDLQIAKNLLNTNYVDGTDTAITTERVRPNKSAALALLARTYLYLGDYSGKASYYAEADSAASAIISNNSEYSLSPLSDVFLKNSSEAIWQWQTPQPAGVDTYDGEYFILLGAPSQGSSVNSVTLSTQLLNSFEPGDQRLTEWVGSIMEGAATYYFPFKYKVNNANLNQEYTMVLRLGEQYLIRAEAKAREGLLSESAVDLNTIRTRAGLPNTTAKTQSDLLTAILLERRVELFCEWGHRWFDLGRAVANKLPVNAVSIMSGANGNGVCHYKGGEWNGDNYQLLFPIPYSDIKLNPNLTQNQGY